MGVEWLTGQVVESSSQHQACESSRSRTQTSCTSWPLRRDTRTVMHVTRNVHPDATRPPRRRVQAT